MDYEVIILGAGAAGLMCAIEAGRRGRRVLVIERNRKPAEKIRISGGGRCNFTNVHTSPDHYISGNPDFCKSALARYTPQDVIRKIERHRIGYHEKKQGQLFCNESSMDVIRMLLDESRESGVQLRTGCEVATAEKHGRFLVTTGMGSFEAGSLVVATGGLSIPKIGATDLGYRLARQFGHRIVPTHPALVPLTFDRDQKDALGEISGVSLDAGVQTDGIRFREKVLFTHRGLSGPAILQASSYWRPGQALTLDLDPEGGIEQELRSDRSSATAPYTLLARHVPRRFAKKWCTLQGVSRSIRQLSDKELDHLVSELHNWKVIPAGTEGYAKAEVTAGGVDTRELSSKTMESRRVPGLYFIGEVVDVTGHLGGFNFQWAWASGYAAGQYV